MEPSGGTPNPPSHALAGFGELLTDLASAIDRLQEFDLTALSDRGIELGLQQLVTEARRLATPRHGLVAEAVARGLPADRKAPSPAIYLRDLVRVTPAEGRAWADDALALTRKVRISGGEPHPPKLPETAERVAAGELSDRHVEVIRHAIEATPNTVEPEVVAEAEVVLARSARTLDPNQLLKVAQRYLAIVDPDGALGSTPEERERARSFTISRQDKHGMTSVKGRLDPETAELLRSALSPLADPRPTPAGPNGEPAVPDERTAAQRQHDALAELARRALASDELPVRHGIHARMLVTIPLRDLARGKGVADGAQGTTLDVRELLRHAAEAGIIPVVLDADGQPLHLGKEQRLATEAQRLALHARDRGCTFPACSTPSAWCQSAHGDPFRNSHRTSVDDLALLCGYHHRYVDRNGWTIKVTDGRVWFVPPDWIDPLRRPRTNEYFRPLDPAVAA